MSAKKYLVPTLIAALLANISTVFAQNKTKTDPASISKEANPQFLIRTERNGKTKYEGCALPNLYFHKATSTTPEGEPLPSESEFTTKGGGDNADEYYGYTFFLVQDEVIIACNESGSFKDQPEGIYMLSGFSYPLSFSPESFIGKEISIVENHTQFEKDPSMHRVAIRLLSPEKAKPNSSTEPEVSSEGNILGQIQADVPPSN